MRLDSLTKIERFMTNALLSSPLIPLGVNVIRLADVTDEEGILQMTNSMVVRYTGASGQTLNRTPLTREEVLSFEVNIASQSYLSQSGHDFAVQLCAGARMTLTNTVPPNTGLEIIEPFSLVSEQFTGLTDSSHYTYTQQWQVTVQDIHRAIALDPCVAAGNCSKLFPLHVKAIVEPGQTVCGNVIYDPILPPPNSSIAYQAEYAGVELDSVGNLVYKWDPAQVFMTAAELSAGYKRVCTNTKDETGRFEIINIQKPDGTFDRSFLAYDTGNRVLNLTDGLINIRPFSYTPTTAGNTEPGSASDMPRNGYGYVSSQQAQLLLDPTNPDGETWKVKYGALFPVADGTTLTYDGVTYTRVGNTPLGRAWINSEDFALLSEDDFVPLVECDPETLEEGKITSCD